MKEILKTKAVGFLAGVCIGAMGALLSQIYVECIPIYKEAEKLITKKLLVCLVILLMLIVLSCLVALYYLTSKKLKYGVYWDRKKNPYCPDKTCGSPIIIGWHAKNRHLQGYCNKCKKEILLDMDTRGIKSVDILKDSL